MGKTWDQKKYHHWLKRIFLKKFLKSVLEKIKDSKAEKILNLGCGEGYPDEYFLKNLPKIELTGVDKDENLLKIAQRKNPKVDYQPGDINQINFKDKQFDLVLIMEVLEHLEDPQKAIMKIKKIASRAIYTVPNEPYFSLLSFLSGKYLLRFGKHPEHLNFWSKKAFNNLLDEFYSEVEIEKSFPWLIGVCQN